MTLNEWFSKKVKEAQWIHHDVKSRVKFRWIYTFVILIILLLFIVAIVFFWLSGLRFDKDGGNVPYTHGENLFYVVIGVAIFIVASILAVIIVMIYYPLLFKKSQELYMHSESFKKQVIKYSKIDLTQFKLKELKWFKRLQWINKVEFNVTKAQIKTKQQDSFKKK